MLLNRWSDVLGTSGRLYKASFTCDFIAGNSKLTQQSPGDGGGTVQPGLSPMKFHSVACPNWNSHVCAAYWLGEGIFNSSGERLVQRGCWKQSETQIPLKLHITEESWPVQCFSFLPHVISGLCSSHMLFIQDLLISWLQQRAWSNAVQIWHKWDSSDCCLRIACVSVIYHHLSWCSWNCSRTPRLKAWDEQVIDTFEVPTLFFLN